MTTPYRIAVLVGSLRKDSFSRKLAHGLAKLAPPELKLDIVEISELPFYDQDLETETPPAAWTSFRRSIQAADGVIFITPEYNRGLPAVLKNAIDVGSRPYGASAWNGKPAAVVSSSPGALGGFGANHQLRQSLVFLNMPTLQHEAYLGGVAEYFDASGELVKESARTFLQAFLGSYADWVKTHVSGKAQAA